MKVITIINTKGGVGKSTLIANLIGQSMKMNYNVAFFDADKQKSLTNWVKKKYKPKMFQIEGITKKKIKKNFEYDFLFIDSPASIRKKVFEDIINISDVFLIPTSLSQIDLITTKKFIEKLSLRMNKTKWFTKIFTILNKVRCNRKMQEKLNESEKFLGVKAFCYFPLSKAFEDQMTNGLTILESNYSKKKEIQVSLINLIKEF